MSENPAGGYAGDVSSKAAWDALGQSPEATLVDKPGGIFVRRAEQISEEDRILVQAVARVLVSDRRGALGEQLNRRGLGEARAPHLNIPRFRPSLMASISSSEERGASFGESIVGAESTPLGAYLAGLVIVQSVLSIGIALFVRHMRARTSEIAPRLAGAAILGVGFTALVAQLIPGA